jgi:hypothetical protein
MTMKMPSEKRPVVSSGNSPRLHLFFIAAAVVFRAVGNARPESTRRLPEDQLLATGPNRCGGLPIGSHGRRAEVFRNSRHSMWRADHA